MVQVQLQSKLKLVTERAPRAFHRNEMFWLKPIKLTLIYIATCQSTVKAQADQIFIGEIFALSLHLCTTTDNPSSYVMPRKSGQTFWQRATNFGIGLPKHLDKIYFVVHVVPW